jgi:predicted amidohydrolase YtcJ
MRFGQAIHPLARAIISIAVGAGCNREPAPPGGANGQPEEAAPAPADLVLHGGKVITVDPAQPSAQAIAVVGDRIDAVGSDEEIRGRIGPQTEVIDLQGRLAIPGFIDAHAHFLSLGVSLLELRLGAARSWEDIVAQVAEAAASAAPGEWVVGRGWHQEKWDAPPEPNVEGLPLNRRLDQVAPNTPVLLIHASGHSALANGKALDIAGIDAGTADPPGGQIVRDRSGKPIGALRENAVELVSRHAERGGTDRDKVVEAAGSECLRHGVTTLHDAGSSLEEVALFRRLADRGELPIRLWVMLSEDDDRLARVLPRAKVVGYGENRVTVRAIKRLIDGALGSHGAWLLEPYTDLPTSSGLNTLAPDALERTARLAIRHGFQLCVHAIGDRGNRETLDVFERVMRDHPGERDLRWRVEHAQHLHPDDLPRFARLGVVASMQPIHCTSDGPWVPTRIGQRRAAEGAYAWKSLIDSGALIAAGTDAPVEEVDPIANFHAAVTRETKGGQRFHPAQRMTRQQALEALTINGARAGFEEDIKGSLTPGKLADIAVLSRDITAVAETEIPGAEVVYTIVGGRIAYRRAETAKGSGS